jgi:predicted acyltransferase
MKPHPPEPFPAGRLMSMDAYRGFVMLLMMAEVLNLERVARQVPESSFWKFLAHHQSHVDWFGCSLHDLIQPSFSFLVGVALPYSLAGQVAKGTVGGKLWLRTFRRALVLIFLGILLRSIGEPMVNFTFEDTLTQIGLGYPLLVAFGLGAERGTWLGIAAIVVGYWLAFVAYPLPGPDFDYAAVGVPADWPYHRDGLAGHFNKNSNLAWAFDTWFLNLFPRPESFTHNGGGYATLSSVPTLGTMLLGLQAGRWLRAGLSTNELLVRFILAANIGLLIPLQINELSDGALPIIKRIWSPGWVLFSGGWCFLLLAGFYFLIDVRRWRGWAFPLVVIGMNSIAAYLLAHILVEPIVGLARTIFGPSLFEFFGKPYASLVSGTLVLMVLYGILWGMYRRKWFLRV